MTDFVGSYGAGLRVAADGQNAAGDDLYGSCGAGAGRLTADWGQNAPGNDCDLAFELS
jgi:hypothetical protein